MRFSVTGQALRAQEARSRGLVLFFLRLCSGGAAPPSALLRPFTHPYVEVSTLNPQIAEQLNLPPSTTGVVVTAVDPASNMADSGLRKGDVIQEVNHQPVKNVSEFQSAIRKGGRDPLLLVNRDGRTLFIAA